MNDRDTAGQDTGDMSPAFREGYRLGLAAPELTAEQITLIAPALAELLRRSTPAHRSAAGR
jgi:hypothetical protein